MTGAYSAEFDGHSYGVGSADFFENGNHFEVHPDTDVLKGFSPETSSALKRLERGEFLLFPESFSDVDPDSLVGDIREPAVNELGKTRERNTQGLIFGQLILKSKSDKEKNTLVAVKPFENLALALNELAATDFVNKSSGPDSFKPLGFYRFDDGAYGLITEYEPEVVSLDNIFWDEENRPTIEQIQKAIKIAALSLSAIHGEGLSHGDFQPKNAVSDNNGPRLADLATAQGFPIGPDGKFKIDTIRGRVWTDVDKFYNNLNTGVEDPEKHGDYREIIIEEFAPLYFEGVASSNSKLPEEASLSMATFHSFVD